MFFIFSFIFSSVALFLAKTVHDKFDPARYFLILWGGQIILIYTLFHKNFIFTGYGLAYISMAILIFSFGTITGKFIGFNIPSKTYQLNFKSNRALFLLKICLFISFINVFLGIKAIGFNIGEIISFKLLLELNNSAAILRYTTDSTTNLIFKVTLIFTYITPIFGGYLLPLISKKKKYWCYFSLLPPVLITLTQSVKMGLITSVALWTIGVLISSYANNKNFINIKSNVFFKIVIYSVLFLSILFLSMVLRTGRFDIDTIHVIREKLINYAFGHLPAFDIWFSKNMTEIDPTGGVKTFYGISNYLGIAERKQGVFTELAVYGKNNYSGMRTNIFTMFRFIIEDFGFIGSFVATFFIGLVSGFSWLMVKKRKHIIFYQTILIGILFSISWSFVASVWAYTSYLVTFVFMYFLLVVSFSRKHKVQHV